MKVLENNRSQKKLSCSVSPDKTSLTELVESMDLHEIQHERRSAGKFPSVEISFLDTKHKKNKKIKKFTEKIWAANWDFIY